MKEKIVWLSVKGKRRKAHGYLKATDIFSVCGRMSLKGEEKELRQDASKCLTCLHRLGFY